jgi:hypothetical protein
MHDLMHDDPLDHARGTALHSFRLQVDKGHALVAADHGMTHAKWLGFLSIKKLKKKFFLFYLIFFLKTF